MALRFAALMQISSNADVVSTGIRELEKASPKELRDCDPAWVKHFGQGERLARWMCYDRSRAYPDQFVPMDHAPKVPSPDDHLITPEGFDLVFSSDSVCVRHLMLFVDFIFDLDDQAYMLPACYSLARMFNAQAGVILGDESPILEAFFEGADYEPALRAGTGKYSEVATIPDLYVEYADGSWYSFGYWRFWPPRES